MKPRLRQIDWQVATRSFAPKKLCCRKRAVLPKRKHSISSVSARKSKKSLSSRPNCSHVSSTQVQKMKMVAQHLLEL